MPIPPLHAFSSTFLLAGLLAGSAAPSVGTKAELRARLEHAGEALDGPTRVKLAISCGARTVWTHDGTGSFEQPPAQGLQVELRDGELRLSLGEPPMAPLPAKVLDDPEGLAVHLWVEVGGRFLRAPGVLPVGRVEAPAETAALGLVRDSDVVEARIARKQNRIKDPPRMPSEREAFRRLQRLDEEGRLPVDGLIRARRHLDDMPILKPGEGLPKDAGIWGWEWLGPGNIGGRIRTILTHPTQPDTLWIGSAGGGIWRTSDGGASWAPVDDFLASLAVTSLVMRPGDPSVLYAATGEGFGNADGLPGAGIFRSQDGGVSWERLPQTNPASNASFMWVNRLAVVPDQPDRLLAITADGKVWRSTDRGDNWFGVLVTGVGGRDLAVHPTQTQWIAAGTTNGVWTSDSAGDPGTWTPQATVAAGKLPTDSGRCEVEFGVGATVMLYASVDRNGGEVWLSSDGNLNVWSLRSTGVGYLGNGPGGGSQGWYNNALWVDPTNGSRLIVGGIDLYRSTDAGGTLKRFSDWHGYHVGTSAHADQHAVVSHAGYDGTANRTVFFGNDGGIQKTVDVWSTAPTSGWTNLANGLGITQFFRGAAAPDGSVILGGSQDNDTLRFKSTTGVDGWFQAETGDGYSCAIAFDNPKRMHDTYIFLQLGKSTDGGNTYVNSTAGLGDVLLCCNSLFYSPFEMDPNVSTTLIAGGTSIWRTTNSAISWSSIRGPVSDGTWVASKCDPDGSGPLTACPNSANPRCTAIAIADADSNVVWIGYESGRVSCTIDGGATWTNPDVGLPGRWVTDIAIHPYDPMQVFVTFGGYLQQSLWFTDDGGASWEDRTGTPPHDLPPIQLNTVTFHPGEPEWVYVGTDLGMLASADRGQTWSKLPLLPGVGHEGPVNTEVADLFWQGGQSLIAATHGRGMYRAVPFGVLYVDQAHSGPELGTFQQPFRTVAAATADAPTGSAIVIKGGTYTEAPLVLTQSGELRAVGGGVLIR